MRSVSVLSAVSSPPTVKCQRAKRGPAQTGAPPSGTPPSTGSTSKEAPPSWRSTSVGRRFQSRSSSSRFCQPDGAAPQCMRAGAPSTTKRCSPARQRRLGAVAAHTKQPTATSPRTLGL
ncbi:MAG TPA: hypothetical protein VGH63_06620 [Polyangia bacterium]